jgi:hypothetical protein
MGGFIDYLGVRKRAAVLGGLRLTTVYGIAIVLIIIWKERRGKIWSTNR